MNKAICIIIPYFGKLPKNINTFLLSCKMNTKINWLIITDQNISKYYNFCKNVIFIKGSLKNIRQRIMNITSLNDINLFKPYKICDYRPLYGIIFSKYLKNYDYWGYSDLDVVYGNLYRYIKTGLIYNYDKIGSHGHFMLLKNTYKMNHLYKRPIIYKNHEIYLFKDIVSKTPKSCHFDEYGGINIICKQYHIPIYDNKDLVNDISFENLDLCTLDKRFVSKYSCFIWNNGHAEYFYIKHNNICNHEYGYFHFQKRHAFKNYLTSNDILNKLFSITTYGYNNMAKLTKNTILQSMKMNKSSFIRRFLYMFRWYIFSKNILNIHPSHILRRIFIDHNFSI